MTQFVKTRVAIAGSGQLGQGVARLLSQRQDVEIVIGPTPRSDVELALSSGADVVIIATTTRLIDVADQIRVAVTHGSNVIVSAEEAAYPWVVDEEIASELDALSRENGVSIVGAGLNPGFVFDALVLTLLGALESVETISVTRTVDISRFGPTVSARLGIGFNSKDFTERVANGLVLGHAGFPQSMAVVARAIGRPIVKIDTNLSAVFGHDGIATGIEQLYEAIGPDDKPWFTARFSGYVDLEGAGLSASDELRFTRSDADEDHFVVKSGLKSQSGSQAIIANSIKRVVAAPPGWLTVAELPPAFPTIAPTTVDQTHRGAHQ